MLMSSEKMIIAALRYIVWSPKIIFKKSELKFAGIDNITAEMLSTNKSTVSARFLGRYLTFVDRQEDRLKERF